MPESKPSQAEWDQYNQCLEDSSVKIKEEIRLLMGQVGERLEAELVDRKKQTTSMLSAVHTHIARMNRQSRLAAETALCRDMQSLFVRYAKATLEWSITPEGSSDNPPPLKPTAYDTFLMAREMIRPQ